MRNWIRVQAPLLPDQGGEYLEEVEKIDQFTSILRGEESGRLYRHSVTWSGVIVWHTAVESQRTQ